MIEFLDNSSNVKILLNSITSPERITVFGCDIDAKLTILYETGKFLLLPISDVKEAVLVKEKLSECGCRVEMLCEKLNYNPFPFDNDYNEKVLKVLNAVLTEEIDVLIVNPMFLHYHLPSVNWLKNKITTLKAGDRIDVDEFCGFLVKAGFKRTDFVTQEGDFVKKGDIVELFSDKRYRLYFDFDALESIKTYDDETLLNNGEVEELTLGGCSWIEDPYAILNGLTESDRAELEQYGSKLNNMICLAPYCNYMTGSILDYLPNDAVVGVLDNKTIFDYLQESIKEYSEFFANKKYKDFYVCKTTDFRDFATIGFQYITNSNRLFNSTKVFNIRCMPVANYRNQNQVLVSDLSKFLSKKYTVLLYAKNKEGLARVANLMEANRIPYNVTQSTSRVQVGQINVLQKRIGVCIQLEQERVVVISNTNLFGIQKQQKNVSIKTETADFLPESGDFVVHNTHGIGKCLGVERLKLSNSARDYVVVEYKNSDKLYLPVENIDSLSKFVGEENPPLNKLGSTDFIKTKEKVRANVKKIAIDLCKLYGERDRLKGFQYPADDDIQKQFEDSFGFEETPDQAQAVLDIKTDMMNGKIMDRLICGDVGFGKTEVALRGAFKTVMAGKQVAFLCPTTILSEQHYNTCQYRMKEFGVTVAVLNRFCSENKVKQVYDGLRNGDIDIVVGTHKLLNKDIVFKNLGLLILDEEQKFGVGDKEKLKQLKRQINVITLSATPIPRTLNMALMGVRDISVIDTPPVSRIPTLTRVQEYSDDLLKSAIENELNRQGQVLIVFNRIEGIFEFAGRVGKMFEGVSIGVTHGQMEQKHLEDQIFKLYNGETQILISTTLIENGIDLPNANTLIVVDADMLGLSQLYQLKGRVGRSDKQAYAYFTFNAGKMLNEIAYKRLEAIADYSAMGSGYKIALKDLEIRGAGKVFGAEQHGHIEKVGYAMYLKLLAEAVSEVKGEKTVQQRDVRVETTLNVFLPYDYIERHDQRMSAYLKISKISSAELLNKCVSELKEIYGDVPAEVYNLCKIAYIKNLASVSNVERVVLKEKASKLVFYVDTELKKIVSVMENFAGNMVLNVEKQPIINLNNGLAVEKKLALVINFLEILAN